MATMHANFAMWVPVEAGEPQRRSTWGGVTPEIYFPKAIDNSRLVRIEDKHRSREMFLFACSVALLFLLSMTYAWQHFSAVEYGYKIEALRSEHDALVEQNRMLRLEQASLRDPERIDQLARRMGFTAPEAGQVMRMETAADASVPEMARMTPVTVVIGN
jgi:cell division protein FtsL